jgi:hypothetical protein
LVAGRESNVMGDVNPLVLRVAKQLSPDRMIEIPNPMDWALYPGFAKNQSLQPLFSIAKSGYYHFLESRIENHYFARAEEISEMFRIPLPFAEQIFERMRNPENWSTEVFKRITGMGPAVGHLLSQLTDVSTVSIILPRELFPVYEVGDTNDNPDIFPFVGEWPYLMKFVRTRGKSTTRITGTLDSEAINRSVKKDFDDTVANEAADGSAKVKRLVDRSYGDEIKSDPKGAKPVKVSKIEVKSDLKERIDEDDTELPEEKAPVNNLKKGAAGKSKTGKKDSGKEV